MGIINLSIKMMMNALKGMRGVSKMSQQMMKNNSNMTKMLLCSQSTRGFRQVHDLHEVVYTAEAELAQRTTKYLERTDKVYKPS